MRAREKSAQPEQFIIRARRNRLKRSKAKAKAAAAAARQLQQRRKDRGGERTGERGERESKGKEKH